MHPELEDWLMGTPNFKGPPKPSIKIGEYTEVIVDDDGACISTQVPLGSEVSITLDNSECEKLVEALRHSKPLTFGELKKGDKFISFPEDGDDSGHGGYRGGSYVFEKDNDREAWALHDEQISSFPPTMKVYKVIL